VAKLQNEQTHANLQSHVTLTKINHDSIVFEWLTFVFSKEAARAS